MAVAAVAKPESKLGAGGHCQFFLSMQLAQETSFSCVHLVIVAKHMQPEALAHSLYTASKRLLSERSC